MCSVFWRENRHIIWFEMSQFACQRSKTRLLWNFQNHKHIYRYRSLRVSLLCIQYIEYIEYIEYSVVSVCVCPVLPKASPVCLTIAVLLYKCNAKLQNWLWKVLKTLLTFRTTPTICVCIYCLCCPSPQKLANRIGVARLWHLILINFYCLTIYQTFFTLSFDLFQWILIAFTFSPIIQFLLYEKLSPIIDTIFEFKSYQGLNLDLILYHFTVLLIFHELNVSSNQYQS